MTDGEIKAIKIAVSAPHSPDPFGGPAAQEIADELRITITESKALIEHLHKEGRIVLRPKPRNVLEDPNPDPEAGRWWWEAGRRDTK